MRLREYLHDGLVVHGLNASHRNGVLGAFADILEKEGLVPSGNEVLTALALREEAHTTALGEGVAVPHATLPDLEDVVLLVATADSPVPFGPPETEPVDLFFVLLSPPGREGEHIKILARICRLVRHPGVLEELRGVEDDVSFREAILRVDSEHV